MTAHAVFAPSAAHRWFECPGSIRLSEGIPNRSSVYADEGSAAHELAARCLKDNSDAFHYVGDTIEYGQVRLFVTENVAAHVQVFVDYVWEAEDKGYEMMSEVKLDLSHLHPGQYGTADAILFNPKIGHLIVADLKYGTGVVVTVDENPQLLSYGSGAYRLYKDQNDVKNITLTVVQPRVAGPPIKPWDTTLSRLREFETEFIGAVAIASAPNAPLVPGEYCRFCPAASVCPALRNKAFQKAQSEFSFDDSKLPALPKPISLSPEEMGRILDAAYLIEAWLEAVKAHALETAINGHMPPGYKLVRKVTHRKWLNEDKTAAALTMMFDVDEDAIYTRKIISPAQAEKLIGKALAPQLTPLVVHPPGDATLVPEADRRPALAVDALKEFRPLLEKPEPK